MSQNVPNSGLERCPSCRDGRHFDRDVLPRGRSDLESPITMPLRRRRNRSIVVALYVNAGLLALIAVAVLTRGGGGFPFESIAFGQQVPQPIAGGAGFFLMPAQFGTNVWGCYVMDVDAQTLVAYRYDPGAGSKGELRLAAARSFRFDRQLRNYNTSSPGPAEVERLVAVERDQARRPDADATTRPTVPQ